MRFIIRWSVTLGLVGSALLGNSLWMDIPAFALSQQQIEEKLDYIPVYLITNEKGIPLSRTVSDQKNSKKNISIITVYMSHEVAKSFINELQTLKTKDTKLEAIVKNLQVSTVPLGYVYKILEKTKSDPNPIQFDLRPIKEEVDIALKLLHESGEKIDEFRSAPIFAVRSGKDKSYIALPDNKQQYVPFFFSEQDAKNLLDKAKTKFGGAYIEVSDVDTVINVFKNNDDDLLKSIRLVPSQESRAYLQSVYDAKTSKESSGKTPSNTGAATGNTGNSTSVKTK